MADEEVDVVGLVEPLLDATEDEGGVTFADFRGHDADGHALLLAQGAGEDVGAIVHGGGGSEDALLGYFGNGFGGGRSAEDARDGGDGEAEVLGEAFEADGGRPGGWGVGRRRGGWIAFSLRWGTSACSPTILRPARGKFA